MRTAYQNPFRVERVHRLPYQFQESDWPSFLERCAQLKFRGAIMGAHGSGKTTLLLELARQLRAAGHSVTELFTNDDAGRSLPKQWAVADSDAIVLADGYDSLNAVGRFRMRRMYSRLIVTSHETCSLPTLHVCEARDEVLRWVVRELTGHAMEQRTAERLLNAHHRNMREAIRALYDLATEDSMLFSAAGNAERVRE